MIHRLRQIDHRGGEVVCGGRPLSLPAADKPAQIWDLMREWLDRDGATPTASAL